MYMYVMSKVVENEMNKKDHHHIVAKKAPLADPVRKILDKHGISVHDERNLVYVRKP